MDKQKEMIMILTPLALAAPEPPNWFKPVMETEKPLPPEMPYEWIGDFLLLCRNRGVSLTRKWELWQDWLQSNFPIIKETSVHFKSKDFEKWYHIIKPITQLREKEKSLFETFLQEYDKHDARMIEWKKEYSWQKKSQWSWKYAQNMYKSAIMVLEES